jgi:hypothetical protein
LVYVVSLTTLKECAILPVGATSPELIPAPQLSDLSEILASRGVTGVGGIGERRCLLIANSGNLALADLYGTLGVKPKGGKRCEASC